MKNKQGVVHLYVPLLSRPLPFLTLRNGFYSTMLLSNFGLAAGLPGLREALNVYYSHCFMFDVNRGLRIS